MLHHIFIYSNGAIRMDYVSKIYTQQRAVAVNTENRVLFLCLTCILCTSIRILWKC